MQLFECLQSIPDPRKKRGIRHPFQPVLKFVLLGFTCRLVVIEHMVSFFKPIWSHLKGSLGFNRPSACYRFAKTYHGLDGTLGMRIVKSITGHL